jgi:hypothetical protein
MRKISLIIGFLVIVLAANFSLLQGRADKNNQLPSDTLAVRNLVQRYCEADLRGATLSTENYRKSGLGEFIISAAGRESAGWDTATIIKGFEILSADLTPGQAVVNVKYESLGEVDSIEIRIKRNREYYNFSLVKKSGIWKLINPYDLRPHISIETAINHIQSLYNEDKELQPNLYYIIRKLKELKRSEHS